MVGPNDVKRKGGASVGYWVNYVTLTFDLTHDLDLWFLKVKFQNTVKCRYNAVSGVQEIDRVIAVTAL